MIRWVVQASEEEVRAQRRQVAQEDLTTCITAVVFTLLVIVTLEWLAPGFDRFWVLAPVSLVTVLFAPLMFLPKDSGDRPVEVELLADGIRTSGGTRVLFAEVTRLWTSDEGIFFQKHLQRAHYVPIPDSNIRARVLAYTREHFRHLAAPRPPPPHLQIIPRAVWRIGLLGLAWLNATIASQVAPIALELGLPTNWAMYTCLGWASCATAIVYYYVARFREGVENARPRAAALAGGGIAGAQALLFVALSILPTTL